MFCRKCGKEIDDNDEFCTYCGTKVVGKTKDSISKEQAIIEAEKSDKNIETYNQETILNFLEKAKLLETRIFGLEQAKTKIQQEINKNSAIIPSEAYKLKHITKSEFKAACTMGMWYYWITLDLPYILGIIAIVIAYKYFQLKFLIKIIASLVSGSLIYTISEYLLEGIIDIFFFLPKMKKRNAEIDEQIKEVEKNTEKQNEIRIKKLEENKEELKILEGDLNETRKLLKSLYSLDILYEKYCNMVAVTTMYEYIKSGRCQTFQGYTGAYNIYETELRQNIIIAKMDDILKSLNTIKKNQFAMYCAIQQGNQIASNALLEAREIAARNAENMNRLNENIRNTEYNTKQIAENTEIMTWISVFSYK